MLNDIRHALRIFRKNLALSIAAILTLALGIGANTSIFAIINSVLIQPLPYSLSERMVTIQENSVRGGNQSLWIAREQYVAWKEQSQLLEQVAALNPVGFNIRLGSGTSRVQGARVSANFLSLLGISPAFGRLFIPQDEKYGSGDVAILHYGFWQDNFGSDPAVIGRNVIIDNIAFMVVGILPKTFDYHYHQDIWIPLRFTKNELETRGDRGLHVVALQKPGVTIEQAQAELNAISQRVQESEPEVTDKQTVSVIPLHEEVVGDVRLALIIFQVAVGFVLLIVCVNMTNLLLAQSAKRNKEIAIRLALGASRRQLIQQFFVESLLLALLGCVMGLAIALWTRRLILSSASNYLPFTASSDLDLSVFVFAIAISSITGVLVGLGPAVQFLKSNFSEILKSGDRSSQGRTHTKLRTVLVIAEVALSVILLIGAGLMIKSLLRLQEINPGFDATNVLKLRIALPAVDYPDEQKRIAYYQEAMARLKTLPGVTSVALINWLPLSRISTSVSIDVGNSGPAQQKLEADCHVITPDYFRVMKISLKQGRMFGESDRRSGPGVVIITERLKRQYFSHQNPIGQHLKINHNGAIFSGEIIGVVGDVRNEGLDKDPKPAIYALYLQPPWDKIALREIVIRTTSNPISLAGSARTQLWSLDTNVPIYQVYLMSEVLSRSIGNRKFNRNLITIFGFSAIVLVIIGVYGLVSYSVNQRTREIGVRMAFGAERFDIVKLILTQGMKIALVGIGIGLSSSIVLTTAMSKLLFGVSAIDPITFLETSLLIAIVIIVAAFFPARRAANLNPLAALRYE